MANSSKSLACVFFVLLILGRSEAQLAPALYVFGDSTVDAGNNNVINTFVKSNYAPYGIDFPGGITGRPTNGYNTADFIALSLGLSPPPAFRLVNNTYTSGQGFNYASSSAGILPETGFKGTLSMVDQVGLFKKTVEEYLPKRFPNPNDLKYHLSKSIFLTVMGVNDYVQLTSNKTGQLSNPDAASQLFLQKFANSLQDLYNLGARKFVVFDVEALGCIPSIVSQLKPQNSKCVDSINAMVLKFNNNLPSKLLGLAAANPDSVFIIGKNYEHILNLVQQPQKYGLKDATNPCCAVTQFGTCDAKKAPCADRDSHVFFDAFHPTQATNKIIAQNCFNGVGVCVPINIKQLAFL